jgi:uncharacterized protein (TIGR03086 family)
VANPDLRPVAHQVADLVRAVPDERLGDPTPCPSYTVGDLLDHLGFLAVAFTDAAVKRSEASNGPARTGDASQLDDDWRERIPAAVLALGEAWTDPDAWTGSAQAGGIEMPGEIAGMVALDELVVHGWDLARGTGQPFEPDDAAVEPCIAMVSQFSSDEVGPDVAFGRPVPVGDGASPLDRLVAATGRDPAWTAG